ncbi:MAG: DUF1259 domain-containing protein, partial [Actinomycetota bacterium]|nr:DUF1259 domain-containing protein [Actinomycetota bacterium]
AEGGIMWGLNPERPVSRRQALALGGGVAGGVLVTSSGVGLARRRDAGLDKGHARVLSQGGSLPVDQMERILDAKADVSSGLVHFSIDRDDAGTVRGPQGVPFSGSFEINGDLYFQPLKDGRLAFFNGDIALRPEELNPVIDAVIANGLVFQAMHQHYFDLRPMWWFIHMRGLGDPLALARSMHNVLAVTSTPFPQQPPANPTTPFDVKRLERILHGKASVGSNGVVTVDVDRTDRITIEHVLVNPGANISTNVQFEPLTSSGSNAAVAPDFSMTTGEVMPVTRVMRHQGWQDHCLYNQETGEHPQLYFSHMLKTGDPYALADEIRKGLNQTAAQ